jgi:hypothetical protein
MTLPASSESHGSCSFPSQPLSAPSQLSPQRKTIELSFAGAPNGDGGLGHGWPISSISPCSRFVPANAVLTIFFVSNVPDVQAVSLPNVLEKTGKRLYSNV